MSLHRGLRGMANRWQSLRLCDTDIQAYRVQSAVLIFFLKIAFRRSFAMVWPPSTLSEINSNLLKVPFSKNIRNSWGWGRLQPSIENIRLSFFQRPPSSHSCLSILILVIGCPPPHSDKRCGFIARSRRSVAGDPYHLRLHFVHATNSKRVPVSLWCQQNARARWSTRWRP